LQSKDTEENLAEHGVDGVVMISDYDIVAKERMTSGQAAVKGQRGQDVQNPCLPKASSTRCFSFAIKSKVMIPEPPGIARAMKNHRSVRK
jgi:hypothetical protein